MNYGSHPMRLCFGIVQMSCNKYCKRLFRLPGLSTMFHTITSPHSRLVSNVSHDRSCHEIYIIRYSFLYDMFNKYLYRYINRPTLYLGIAPSIRLHEVRVQYECIRDVRLDARKTH